MSKSKIVGMMALIAFAMGIFWVGETLAGESGKFVIREVYYATTVHTLKVPDLEGHTNHLIEGKGIGFYEKWGACLLYVTCTMDLIKGEGPVQGYVQYTFPDGSTLTVKFEGKTMRGILGPTGGAQGEGTGTYIKGTGKFEGFQGRGTYKSCTLGPGQWYSDVEGEYTLP